MPKYQNTHEEKCVRYREREYGHPRLPNFALAEERGILLEDLARVTVGLREQLLERLDTNLFLVKVAPLFAEEVVVASGTALICDQLERGGLRI